MRMADLFNIFKMLNVYTCGMMFFFTLRNVCEVVIQISTVFASSQKAISLVLVVFITSEYIMDNVYEFVM